MQVHAIQLPSCQTSQEETTLCTSSLTENSRKEKQKCAEVGERKVSQKGRQEAYKYHLNDFPLV
ncbi:hypothetical protein Krac_6310 [Ktedonobacter racemifer DSM 44963]|uniref:Uncharacterized protein n=1 Tax=Ktedonobacter racemifer DSM 44963 TaxID=485913 RepID=D6TYS3_KTERA|nr:hypothetical protein Krac_6310 [Ktedonobacter racemifer DSM 44963]